MTATQSLAHVFVGASVLTVILRIGRGRGGDEEADEEEQADDAPCGAPGPKAAGEAAGHHAPACCRAKPVSAPSS